MTERNSSAALRLQGQGPVFMLSLGHGATHWVMATLYVLLPSIRESLQLSYVEAGLFLSVYHVSSFAANFVSGLAVDVSGRRVLVQVVALLIGGFAILAFGLTSTYLILCIMVGLMGASNQAWHPGAISYLADNYPQRRGYVLSIHAMGASAGDALAPIVAGSLLVVLSWQNTAVLSSLPALLAAVILIATLLPTEAPSAHRAGMGARRYFAGYWALLKNRAVIGLTLTAGFRSMAQVGLFAFLPLYIVEVMEKGTVFLGVALMTIQIGGFIAAPIAGMWSDRVGQRPIVFGALGMSTIIIVALTLIGNPTLYVACISLLGFFLFAIRPVVQSWMMGLVPSEFSGSATSLMFGVQSILAALAPIIGGVVADRFGLGTVFYVIAGVMLFANILVLLIPRSEEARET